MNESLGPESWVEQRPSLFWLSGSGPPHCVPRGRPYCSPFDRYWARSHSIRLGSVDGPVPVAGRDRPFTGHLLSPHSGFIVDSITSDRYMSRTSRYTVLTLGVAVSAIGCYLLSTMDANGLLTGLRITAKVVAAGVAVASLPLLFAPLVAPVHDLTPRERSRLDLPPGEPVKVLAAGGFASAFAAGVLPGLRVVFVTTGLLHRLTTTEAQAIVAHERGHHQRRHVTLRLGSVVLFVAPWLTATATGVPGGFEAGLLALGPAVLIVCWLGRWTEYDADAYAARQVGGPALASALEQLHAGPRLSTEGRRLTALLSMHPPIGRRLAKLSSGVSGALGAVGDDDARSVLVSIVASLTLGVLTAFARRPSVPRFPNVRSPWENVLNAMVHVLQMVETAFIRWRGTVVYEASTPHQSLRVVDYRDARRLFLDGVPHSAMDLSDPSRHVFDYTRYFHLPFLFCDDIADVLFVGGGGFTGPKRFLAEYDVTVDVIEHDPAVVDTARRFFDVETSDGLTVHVGDGRQFLRETDRTYDLIVLDAFQAGTAPSRLTTLEFLQLTRDSLSADGALFANLVSTPNGPLSKFYRLECETLASVFPRVYSFPTVGWFLPQNIEIVATMDEELVAPADLRRRNERGDAGIDLSGELDAYRYVSPTDGGQVLRDDDLLDRRS